MREEERPGGPDGLKVRWKWRIETGRKAGVIDARQAEAIRKALLWLHQHPPQQYGGPAEPVPVAVLARTSTLALQDPAASLRRQITSTREWLPPGFYVAGYYWDVESGGLDLEDRGHGHYEQFTAQGIPRDGGLADLLAEARSPQPRFAAVVVEDIERASRDFYNSIKLERELSDQGIPFFATDEPADIKGVNPTTLLIRRVKQGFAEYFRLQLKEKVWKGLKEHSDRAGTSAKSPTATCPRRSPTPTRPKPPRACPKPGWPGTRTGPRSSSRSTSGGP